MVYEHTENGTTTYFKVENCLRMGKAEFVKVHKSLFDKPSEIYKAIEALKK